MSILILLIAAAGLPAAEIVVFGLDSGWDRTVSEGLMPTEGWRGYPALTLAPLGRNPFESDTVLVEGDIPPERIDLLLLAEPGRMDNPAGGYTIEGRYQISTRFKARGLASIRPGEGGLSLVPSETSMWKAGKEWNDFTLDFRLRPATLRDGEVFFSWEGRDIDGQTQSIVAVVRGRRLVWEFHNVFRKGRDRSLDFVLESPPLVPGEWRHHRIRFKHGASAVSSGASPGLLEYLVDGIPSDMVHATPDGREGPELFTPRIGALSEEPIQLAPSFSGYFDEFRLAAAYADRAPAGGYADRETAASGSGRTWVMDSGYPGSELTHVRARILTPGSTRIRFYARTLSNPLDIHAANTPSPNDPAWAPLPMIEESEDPTGFGRWYSWTADETLKGRYFVVGYVLDPDPAADLAPVLSALEAEYEPRLPPRPPRDLRRESTSDGSLRLSWSSDAEDGVAGWWVSWGPRPGDYVPTAPDDRLHGTAWIPRTMEHRETRPEFVWPAGIENSIIYTSVRAAWLEGGPAADESFGPADYRALSEPTMEMNFRP